MWINSIKRASLQGRLWSHVRTLEDANLTNDAPLLFLPREAEECPDMNVLLGRIATVGGQLQDFLETLEIRLNDATENEDGSDQTHCLS